ncbi:hypothetical protein L596_022963 [Steinernema carpocapsae]|uniref:Uncharacterized protein n=1 Tax=Steinernema carpocapsae TaxID=34508 RepID=A0A4U5MD24_STECR|nr:hypothetical protein L596_022963 [Steinernema carpocapsae]
MIGGNRIDSVVIALKTHHNDPRMIHALRTTIRFIAFEKKLAANVPLPILSYLTKHQAFANDIGSLNYARTS